MTTIVYDHKRGVIACDGRINADGVILSDSALKYKMKDDGSVWFFSGSTSDEEDLINLKHNDKPDVKADCAAIYANNDGVYLVTFNGDYCSHTKLNYNHSIGSGYLFALSALDFGKTATESVEYASTKDCYTGGEIIAFDVNTLEFI